MTLKDKVALYENFLTKIAAVNPAEMEARGEALAPDKAYKHAFALGYVRSTLQEVASDAQYALSQGKK
jgi:hypothetical protein